MAAVVGLALVGGIVALVCPREREPVYQGKTLSEWLSDPRLGGQSFSMSVWNEVGDAVRGMGTNSIPFLLRWVSHDRPVWRQRLYGVAAKVPVLARRRDFMMWLAGDYEDRMARGVAGFSILGSAGRCAIPDLSRVATNGYSADLSYRAEFVLALIGREAVPALLDIVGNDRIPSSTRVSACDDVGFAWGDVRTSFKGLDDAERKNQLPRLLKALEDRDASVRIAATNVVSWFSPGEHRRRQDDAHGMTDLEEE